MGSNRRSKAKSGNRTEAPPVPIVSYAIVAGSGPAAGKTVPALILDTASRPDIEDLIKTQKDVRLGDVTAEWSASGDDKNRLSLVLTIPKPIRCVINFEFSDIAMQGGFIDLIIRTQCLYIKSGKDGDRMTSSADDSCLLLEASSKNFQKEWDSIFHKAITKDFQKKGNSRDEAKIAAANFIKDWRESRMR